MRLYIIVIEYLDLKLFDSDYLDSILEQFGKYAKLTSTSYLVRTEASSSDIRSTLLEKDTDIDRIFVTACEAPSAWRGMIASNENIKELLRDE